MRIVRGLTGSLILFLDRVTSPRPLVRNAEAQSAIDKQAAGLVLYQFLACPFCVKVRRYLKRNAITIQTKDARRSDDARAELLNGGGMVQVPCLRIEGANGDVTWLYESDDIIAYLDRRFGADRRRQ